MRKRLVILLPIVVAIFTILAMATPAWANPPSPEEEEAPAVVQPPEGIALKPYAARAIRPVKPIDQPNIKDYLRNRQRQKLLEAGQTAEAQALQLQGTDRVLVILVEFAGTDVFTWNPGDTWDPYGRADPNEAVYDEEGNVVIGDCSNIITQTTVFTYTGPAHNQIPRPLSAEDRSGDTIWTEDFSPGWFQAFMFGDGVTFDYVRQDGSVVHEDFTGQSVRDYYEDLSGGRYHITGDVIGWLQLPHSTWWYGADECPGARSGGGAWSGAIPGAGSARTLVIDALNAVNAISDTIPGFDWANYDRDGDGIIDRLWIVHSGYGEEDSTTLLNRTDYSEASLWSHSSAISPPYEVAPGIYAGPYIMMPENGGIGVFAHEYGHNLGADDLYAYGPGETSAGFWTLMADDWTGYPIGFEPPALDPWHLDNWGWLEPFVITDTTKVYEVTLGQASRFPGDEDVYRGAKIVLPEGVVDLPVPVWQGDYYWWGGKLNLSNAMMTTKEPITIPEGGATLSFDLVYDIEDEWDFLWIQVSTVPSPEPSGVAWDTLTNENTKCVHDPDWIGPLYGFPDGDPNSLCDAGIGGFYGYNPNWPEPETQVFDLSKYAGQSIYLRFWYMTDWATLYTGAFVDNVKVEADGNVLFFDDAEAGDAKWVYNDPWVRSDGTQSFTHNFYLQWRNVNENGGYDSALGEPRWRFGPANTGLLVWYNNNFYTDNEVFNYLFDYPGFGPKGRMLVVDSHPEPYRDPDYVTSYPNEGANIAHRGLMRDAPFTLQDTVPFTHTDPYRPGAKQHSYPGRPAVSEFHDSMGYYPGGEYAVRSPYQAAGWMTKQWDASVNVPSREFYGIKAPGYTGNQRFRFGCSIATSGPYTGYLLCYSVAGLGYDGGTGNPGDYEGPYGWHVKLIEEAADHTWGKVRIWNSQKELDVSFEVDKIKAEKGDELTYTCDIEKNIGSKVDALAVIPLDTKRVEYVPGSAFGGAVPMPCGFSPEDLGKLYASKGLAALKELSSSDAEVCSIVWTKSLGTGEGADPFGFSVEVTVAGGQIKTAAHFVDDGEVFQVVEADTVTVTARILLPLVFKSYPPPPTKITILHTNDFHGYLETDSRGRGGSAYMAGKINEIRAEVGKENVALLDAGDIYLGAAPISQLLLGESAIDIYNMIGYDVAAYGNHEFDKGQDVLQTRTAQSEFPWVSANIVLEGTEWEHPTWTEPYVILHKGGLDIGILGLTTDETPLVTLKGTTAGLEFKDLTETVLHYYDEVKAKSDALIVLAHMGTEDSGPYKGLKTVAQELIAAGKPVDLMIGGHQHQPLYEPVMVGDTAIIQAGYYGRWLGRADITVNARTKSLTLDHYELITITNKLTPDPEVEARVAYWHDRVAPILQRPVGYTNVSLVRDYNAESIMGDLVTDGMRWKADQYDDGEVNGSVDIAFTNPGGLRADIVIPEGATLPYTITWGDTFNVMPFGNTLYLMDLTGWQIQALLDQAATLYKGILQTSGASWYWYNDCNCNTPTAWGAYDVKVGGEPLVYTKTYRVVTNNFLAGGQDGWVTFAEGTNRWDTYYDMQEAVNEYIATISPIDPEDIPMGRIIKLDKVVTILHTNDEHGRAYTDTYRGNPIGLTYLASLVKHEQRKNPNVLLMSASDTIQGNAFAFYFRNAPGPTPGGTTTLPNPIIAAMNTMGYDVTTIGNHEFNFGRETFAKAMGQWQCPIVAANVSDDGRYGFITDNVKDYVTFDVEGLKVAVMGLTNPRVPSYELPSNILGLTFTGGWEAAQALVPQIRANEQPDLLVALTHLGYSPYEGSRPEDTDVYLADNVPGIDVIVGGHSHTKLDPAVLRTSITNTVGTLIAQAERHAYYLGKVNVGFKAKAGGGYEIVLREGRLLPAGLLPPDPDLEALLAPYLTELNAYTGQVIGESTVALDARTAFYEETAASNLQVDASKWVLEQAGIPVDFHLSGAMTNAYVPTGTLKVQDMFTLMPYENSLVVMRMNGPQIKYVLERSFYNYDLWRQGKARYTTCFLDISQGGVITYDPTVPESGDNVVSLTINGVPVDFTDANTYYNVSTVNYLAAGACSYSDAGVSIWPLDQITYDTQYYVRDAVIDYIKAFTPVSPQVEGRIVFTQ